MRFVTPRKAARGLGAAGPGSATAHHWSMTVSSVALMLLTPAFIFVIATAIGLFAAIPAVIAYNRFSARGEMLIGRYYTFADEFQAILHRKVHTTED